MIKAIPYTEAIARQAACSSANESPNLKTRVPLQKQVLAHSQPFPQPHYGSKRAWSGAGRIPLAAVLLAIGILIMAGCAQPERSLYDELGLEEITVDALQQGYAEGHFNTRQVVQAYLDRIEAIDRNGPALNAVRALNPDALQIADQLDRERSEGNLRGPLHGVPILLKDNIDTADMPTTAGSRFMDGSVPPEDAFIVKRLREQGAVVLGKTNLSEWANFHSSFSSSGWSGLGGQVNNPFDPTRNPCGSSSGSGAAASANLTVLAIGTETNGSIVCPSSANGIVGMKPTVGLWSRSGIIPISHTTDSAGPMVRTVRDAAILLGALTGVDPADDLTAASESHIHPDYTVFLNADGLQGKRIGLFKPSLGGHFRVDTLMHQTVRRLEELGATVVEIDRISEENIGGAAFQVLLYEFRDGLDAYFASLGPDAPVKSMEHLAELTRENPEETAIFDRNLIFQAAEKGGLDSPEYREALERMLLHSRERGIDRVMAEQELDAFVGPTGSQAWKTDLSMGDNFKVSSSSPSARAGYPIITLPMGYIDGLPVGVSFWADAWSEPVLLEIAYAFEQATGERRAP
ncbi:MAG: amidase [Cyclonatronaceae bacterium]